MQYLLDIETLLLFLSSRGQSGELTASFKRFPGLAYKGSCYAHLTLVGGKLASCTLRNEKGTVLLEGEDAFHRLKKMGQLDWSWQAVGQTGALPALVPAQSKPLNVWSLVYRRVVPIEMVDKRMLTRKHWQVLLLVDGSRTVAHIASVLLPSPSPSEMQEVIRILHDLQQQGIIAITRN
jgi:hypothetical protein